MIVVSNASPLIILSKVECLELLPSLFSNVFITPEVFEEVAIAGEGRPAADAVKAAKWINVKPCSDIGQLTEWKQRFGLGAGEVSTVLLAQELQADLSILDEQRGRQFAKSQKLNVMGSVGIIEAGYRKSQIADLREIYQRLSVSGTHIDPAILNRSLAGFNLPSL